MKKILLSIVFYVVTVFAIAQKPDLQFAERFGGTSFDNGQSIAVDLFGNVYTCGNFEATADFDPGTGVYNLTSVGLTDIFVCKHDSAGALIWAKSIGSIAFEEANSICVDLNGKVYITGAYSGSADFDPGVGVYNLVPTGGTYDRDIFICKLDSLGMFVWAKSIGNASGNDLGYSLLTDSIGNVYSTGTFYSTADFDTGVGVYNLTAGASSADAYICKMDSSGALIWAKNMGDKGRSIALDKLGNVYTTGTFWGTADFNPGIGVYNLSSAGGQDIFISKLNSLGLFVWAKSFGGPANDNVYSIALDAFGYLYSTGSFYGLTDFDPGPGSYAIANNCSSDDSFLSKLDTSGAFSWVRQFGRAGYTGSCVGYSVTVAADGSVYTAGRFSGYMDFDPGVGTFHVISGGTYDAFINKLDSLGAFLWVTTIGTAGSSAPNSGNSLTLDKKSNIYLTGSLTYWADFDPTPGVSILTSVGGSDVFILKLANNYNVWPGDANYDHVVDNIDLLPIGLFYSQTGISRTVPGNVWQADSVANWGIQENNGADIKHADCNGDGIIDNNDTLAVNLNFSLTHAFAPINSELRLSAPDLHFVTSSSSYLSGSIVDVQVWLGNSTTAVSNLYGIAFDINYDASLVQPSSESLTYPTSWLGTPATDAITIAKIDAVGNTAYGAETRINQINASGFGKIADFKFQLKSAIPANTVMYFSTSGYQANDASGVSVLFSTPLDSIIINPTSVGVSEINSGIQISIYPNPSNGSFNIFTSEQIKNGSIEVYNTIGELILSQKTINQQNTIDIKNQASGLYFVKVISDGEVIGMKKVVKE